MKRFWQYWAVFIWLAWLPCAVSAQSRTGEIYTDTLWIQYVGPNEEKGFSFGYFLAVPRGLERGKKYFLLAQTAPNLSYLNGGRADQTAGALRFLQAYPLLFSLQTPVIMPVFTHMPSAPNLRTGALDRDVMQIREGILKRPDLQFLAMLKDARKRLKKENIRTHKKIWLHGFGASGDFCARFIFLHPKQVQAAVCGGTDGVVPVPVKQWRGQRWVYPLGVGDIQEITGRKFDAGNWKRTPQFYYAVGRDDSLTWAGAAFMGREEAKDVLEILGPSVSARWNAVSRLLKQSGAAVQTHFYSRRAFEPAWKDAASFFKAHSADGFHPTLPKEM